MNRPRNELVDGMNKYQIPERMRPGILRWIEEGIIPGSFLQAVIENDLKSTMMSADIENACIISSYVHFFYNHAPGGCWGSKERVKEWHTLRNPKPVKVDFDEHDGGE